MILETTENATAQNVAEAEETETTKFEKCRNAAIKGEKANQYELATRYFNGTGTEIDYKKAFNWYVKSADGGNSKAKYAVGMMCEKGLGTEENLKRALLWYNKAAEDSHSEALFRLGILHVDGVRMAHNLTKGHMYLNLAFLRGKPEAEPILKEVEAAMTIPQKEDAFTLAREFRAQNPVKKKTVE